MTIIYSSKKLRPRDNRDFYPTPQEFANFTLHTLVYDLSLDKYRPYRVLDPGCGEGVWGKSVKIFLPNSITTGIDIHITNLDNVYNNTIQRDYLEVNYGRDFEIVIGNPPYRLAEQFLDKSYELVVKGGYIIFLLRSAFAEGKHRYDKYFSMYKAPRYIYQSVSRISFTGDGKSDNTAYSVFVWQNGYAGSTTFSWMDWKNNGKNNSI